MHELGLCEGVLESVRRRAQGRAVNRVRLRAGVRHAVDPESMAQVFLLVAEGTEAAGATVDVIAVPMSMHCRGCGYRGETADPLALCPRCASDLVDLSGGDELVLESVEYAAPATEPGTDPAPARPGVD